jgi:hypothetical protein
MSDFEIDDKTRLDFNNMLKESGASDNTKKIRDLKHSDKIREQVTLMVEIKKKYPKLKKAMKDRMIESKCTWLWENYMNIYNKLKKDELDLNILHNFLSTLKQIENGELDQHNASVKAGKILKELYIDSTLKQQTKREKLEKKRKKRTGKPIKKISWAEYKKIKM